MPERRDIIRQRFSSNLHQARLKAVAEPFATMADEIFNRDPDPASLMPETVKALRALKTAQDSTVVQAIAVIEAASRAQAAGGE